ncbi:MAG: hypothetical protein ACT4RN_01145 [Pseudonocardia sp.]
MDLLSVPDVPVAMSDEAVGPDQYRYVTTRAWWLGTVTEGEEVHAHLAEHVVTRWVPACPERDWLLDHRVTGRVQWLSGDGVPGFDPADGVAVGRFRAPYGDFHAEQQGRRPGRRAQGWHAPTPTFLAGLPHDPAELLDRLCLDNPTSRWSGPFVAAAATLRTCLVPAPLRTAMFRALCLLPAVTVARDVAALDGRCCAALVHDDGPTRTELLVDPVDGQYAGERDTLRRDSPCGLPAGTMIATTSVRTGVVDDLGDGPV